MATAWSPISRCPATLRFSFTSRGTRSNPRLDLADQGPGSLAFSRATAMLHLALCFAMSVTTTVSSASPVATPTQVGIRAAVAKALPLIQKGAAGHMEHRTCFACHHQAVPILAMTTARARGFDVPD